MAKKSVIVFDLDDTLYSKSDVFYQTFTAFATPTISPLALYNLYQEHSDVAFELFSAHQLTLSESHFMRIRATFKSVGIDIDDDTIEQFRQHYQYNLDHIQLSQEWQETLAQLTADGYELAILTNGPTNHQLQKLYQLNLKHFIPKKYWYISETLGFKKPDRRAFAAVEHDFTDTDFWMVGDYLTNDVQGALNAGWHSIHYIGYRPATGEEPASHPASSPQEVYRIITTNKT